GADRQPLWPDGIVGSITHSANRCVVVAGRTSRFLGVGVDLETNEVPPHLAPTTLSATEAIDDLRTPLRLKFSAKESIFKCVFPKSESFLEYCDVAVDVDPLEHAFYPSLN